jgi:hypothetical protein
MLHYDPERLGPGGTCCALRFCGPLTAASAGCTGTVRVACSPLGGQRPSVFRLWSAPSRSRQRARASGSSWWLNTRRLGDSMDRISKAFLDSRPRMRVRVADRRAGASAGAVIAMAPILSRWPPIPNIGAAAPVGVEAETRGR